MEQLTEQEDGEARNSGSLRASQRMQSNVVPSMDQIQQVAADAYDAALSQAS
jgi:hypothetical protein